MRVASDIGRVASGSRGFRLNWARSIIDGCLSSRLNTRCDQLYLVEAITNGPVASSLANDIDQFEEGTLIPILSDLLNLSVRIESNNVDLSQKVSASHFEAGRGTYNWKSNHAIREEVVV
jgi:hypothetical protein